MFQALHLRSVDHVFNVIHIQPNFLLTDERVSKSLNQIKFFIIDVIFLQDRCFSRLYQYCNEPDWRKGFRTWQLITKSELDDPFQNEKPLRDAFCKPRPDLDLRQMKKESPVAINIPETVLASISDELSSNIS